MKNEFYIGYINKLPKQTAKTIKKSIFVLIFVFVASGVVIALHHQKVSNSKFELGQLSTIEGYYFNEPVPMIKLLEGKDIHGNHIFKSIPLVNYAKFGVEELVGIYEEENKISLQGKKVKIVGTYLYDDGKALFELTKRAESILEVSSLNDPAIKEMIQPKIEKLGVNSIKGEIVDSKCYFGAMRPGFGKTHRACAVRCISGGIPPVLAATNYSGEVNYFLIRGSEKEAINKEVLPYVAEPVRLTGELVKIDDWMVIYVNPKSGIERVKN
ncbi:hypothetical protein [Marinifilum caeruleilacunae]|uniref:Uncharacterized protein n=1 Tax=Marinifilum caeruleilacunae TaxID=2499076 RepID=A0ABX1WZ18_9BACT|nr:hypothetical protein [Marinifilum caeruleilacunae]NOU61398.1 hypothetical protein [Marinifilum caeruleilacunae]